MMKRYLTFELKLYTVENENIPENFQLENLNKNCDCYANFRKTYVSIVLLINY